MAFTKHVLPKFANPLLGDEGVGEETRATCQCGLSYEPVTPLICVDARLSPRDEPAGGRCGGSWKADVLMTGVMLVRLSLMIRTLLLVVFG